MIYFQNVHIVTKMSLSSKLKKITLKITFLENHEANDLVRGLREGNEEHIQTNVSYMRIRQTSVDVWRIQSSHCAGSTT